MDILHSSVTSDVVQKQFFNINKLEVLSNWTLQYSDGSSKRRTGVDGQVISKTVGGIFHRNRRSVDLLLAISRCILHRSGSFSVPN